MGWIIGVTVYAILIHLHAKNRIAVTGVSSVASAMLCVGLILCELAYNGDLKPDTAKVVSTISTPKTACNDDRPLGIIIKNRSDRILNKAYFEVRARFHGHSDEYAYKFIASDFIINPHTYIAFCEATPKNIEKYDAEEFDWTISTWGVEWAD